MNNDFSKALRLARIRKGWSLEDLSKAHPKLPSKQMLNRYEQGHSAPSPETLRILAEALGVSISALLMKIETEIDFVAFRKLSKLGAGEQEKIKAEVSLRVEGQRKLSAAVGEAAPVWDETTFRTEDPAGAELDARKLRQKWELSIHPVPNLISLLEKKGASVLTIDADPGFSGISGWISPRNQPVLAIIEREKDGARQRMDLAHELAHVVLSKDAKVDPEDYAKRFAGAFLLPKQALVSELGQHRSDLRMAELRDVKLRYGLSIQAVLRRARDLNIISESTYKKWCIDISKQGLRKDEGEPYVPVEKSSLVLRLASRAVTEDLLTLERAAQYGGLPSDQIQLLEKGPIPSTPQKMFLKMSRAKRAKAFLDESKAMKRFYAKHPKEILPDLDDGSDD